MSCHIDASLVFLEHCALHAARTQGKPLAGVRLPRRPPFLNSRVNVDYSGPLDAWFQLRQELRQWRRGGRPLREIVAQLNVARDGVRRQILRSELSTPSALKAPAKYAQKGMNKMGNATANILKLLSPNASDLTSYLQRRRLVMCGKCGTSGCDRREAAREWSGALPSVAVSASALGDAGGDVTSALRTLLGERKEVLAGCTECFSMQELEAGSRQAGTARAVVYGQHRPGTAAWQHSGDAPELLLAELPELEQGWEAWEAGRWALEAEMELDLPLVGGDVLPVCYRLVAVIQYDGGHYACDARDPSDDCWYYTCRYRPPYARYTHTAHTRYVPRPTRMSMFARYRYDALHGAPTPTPAVPTVAPLGPGRAVEPDLMQSREARCWPVLAAWAVVPLDNLQMMLVG